MSRIKGNDTGLFMDTLVGIAVLSSLIFLHELGHFLAARLQGIYANRFAIGFGPILWKYQTHDTEFSLRLLPIGGFVGFPDEDPESTIPPDDPNLLKNRPILDRALVMVAGVVANLIISYLAVLVFVVIAGVQEPTPGLQFAGRPGGTTGFQAGDTLKRVNDQDLGIGQGALAKVLKTAPATFPVVLERKGQTLTQTAQADDLRGVRILGVTPKEPAALAGMQAGDLVLEIGGKALGVTPESSEQVFRSQIKAAGQQPLALVILREGKRLSLTATPSEKGQLGVMPAPNLVPSFIQRPQANPVEALAAANQRFFLLAESSLKGYGMLFSGQVGLDQLSSPVGIVKYTADVSSQNPVNLLLVAALLSFSLAILNLLPIPGLDGSHLAFLLLEAIRGKPISENIQNRLLQTGLIFLMGLSVVLILKDSVNWILTGSPF